MIFVTPSIYKNVVIFLCVKCYFYIKVMFTNANKNFKYGILRILNMVFHGCKILCILAKLVVNSYKH